MLQSDDEEKCHLAYKLSFPCSNNEAEYEALILGLLAVKERGIKILRIAGDSKLVVLQIEGVYALKEPTLAPYRVTVQKLMKFFKNVNIIHKLRSDNRFPDALATQGARTEFEEENAYIESKNVQTIGDRRLLKAAQRLARSHQSTANHGRGTHVHRGTLLLRNFARRAVSPHFLRVAGAVCWSKRSKREVESDP